MVSDLQNLLLNLQMLVEKRVELVEKRNSLLEHQDLKVEKKGSLDKINQDLFLINAILTIKQAEAGQAFLQYNMAK